MTGCEVCPTNEHEIAVAIKTVGLWWKLHNISFEISNGYVLFDGYACDIKLQGSILPFGIGSFIEGF